MAQIYEDDTILHFLDIFKFSSKVNNLIQQVFEYCGPKAVIEDARQFCKLDKDRCTWPIVLSNAWWRSAVLLVQNFRIFVNLIHLCWYAYKRNSMEDASEWTSSRWYDIGDDIGSGVRFILDFRVDEEIEQSEWD